MDFLLGLVDINENVNYTYVVYCAIVYVFIFWGIVCAWIGKDAYRRYGYLTSAGVFWFLATFLLGVPAMILYMIIRPEEVMANSYFWGGVNVPIANFVGKNGEFVMGLQLKINSAELTEQARDMRLSIDWESEDPEKRVTPEAVVAEAAEVGQKITSLKRLLSTFRKTSKQSKQQVEMEVKKQTEDEKRIQEGTKAIEKALQSAVREADRLDIPGNNDNRPAIQPQFAGKKKHKKKRR